MESKEKLILIVEDEPKIAALLSDYLQAQGSFNSVIVERGDQALEMFLSKQPDLVLLDLMLPGLDGIEVCKQLRAQSQVPIIMVTARVDEIDRLLGLELGADEMNKYKDFRKLQGQLFANQERMAGIGFATSALGAQPRPQTPFPGVRI